MKNFKTRAKSIALAIFLGLAVLGVAAESMAFATPPSINHGCGGSWGHGPRGGHGCGW